MYYKPTKLDQNHLAIFEKKKILLTPPSYCELQYLYFQSKGENYNATQDIFVRTLDIELDLDWSVCLCAMLGDGHTRTFFSETLFSGCGSNR